MMFALESSHSLFLILPHLIPPIPCADINRFYTNYQEDAAGTSGYGTQGTQYQGGDQYQGDQYVQADYYPPGSAGYDAYGGDAEDGGYSYSGPDELVFSGETPVGDGSDSTDRGENEDW
jgi:hypothetical protein